MKVFKAGIILIIILILAGIITGCNNKGGFENNGKIKVGVTILPQAELVEAVGGELVQVKVLVPQGASPETYEPTPKDVADFNQADIFFALGLPAEEAKGFSIDKGMKVIELDKKVAEVYPERKFEDTTRDPHIWLSIKRSVVMVEEIASSLGELDPENKELYKGNANEYIAQLKDLDQKISALLEESKGKEFIIFHPALGYFAADYSLSMYALEEEGKEASPGHLIAMVELAKDKNIKGLLMTSEADAKQGEAFAQEIGGKIVVIETLGKDYIDMMYKLAENIGEVL